jgi:5-(carboxyamino)imidazole ribonucleotide mutase
LQKKVLEEKADLGIAPDGDGDRVFFVNEKGEIVWSSLISALVASKLLQKYPGDKIGVDVRYLFNIKNTVEKSGGKIIIGPVGHALISDLMIKNDILFTGESSGHFFFRQFGYAESAISTILLVLDEITKRNKPISYILKEYQNVDVIITVAGRSNALSGFVDAHTTKPVIACPPYSDKFCGADIYSSLRMPKGVAPLVVLEPEQAALAAAKIIALKYPEVTNLIEKYQNSLKEEIEKADQEVLGGQR